MVSGLVCSLLSLPAARIEQGQQFLVTGPCQGRELQGVETDFLSGLEIADHQPGPVASFIEGNFDCGEFISESHRHIIQYSYEGWSLGRASSAGTWPKLLELVRRLCFMRPA